MKTEVVLVIAARSEEAKEWISEIEDKKGRVFVWAPGFSAVLGRDPKKTLFVGVGDFDFDEDAQKAYWWCKEKGYRAYWREASNE